MAAQRHGVLLLPSAQIPSQKLQRRQVKLSPKHQVIDHHHQKYRNHRGLHKSLRVPDGHVGGQAVAAVIHPGADLLQGGIAQNIADQGADQRHDGRHGHIMPDQFIFRITGSPQGADHIGLPGNGVAGGDSENESHDQYNNIQKDDHHGLVASHIVAGKLNGLVLIGGNEILQLGLI